MTTIIHENERGLLFKNGKLMRLLSAGKYLAFGSKEIEVLPIDKALASPSCDIDTLLKNAEIAAAVTVAEVGDEEFALHFVDGSFAGILRHGKHAFFTAGHEHTFRTVDITTPEVAEDVPRYIFTKIPALYYHKFEVADFEQARLFFDGKLVRILEAGTHYFWRTPVKVDVDCVDTRLTQMTVTGQELLTADKVSLRVNLVCSYRIADPVKILTEVDDYAEQLHVAAQLALRDYVGAHKLDDILEHKEEMSAFVTARLKTKAQTIYIAIEDAGVKDIILPGEIRDIMNTVLIAEKRAQANVITRREEVASTRSLLNTARLMDENQTLYKLKELEFLERICENVGSITVNGSGDILSQLAGILKAHGT